MMDYFFRQTPPISCHGRWKMVLIRSPDKGHCFVKIRYDWETTVRGGVGMLNQYDRHSPKENKNKRPRKWDREGGSRRFL